MKQKLVFIDLDGTLLDGQKSISPKSVETINKVIQLGHLVIIATGRPWRISKNYYHQLNLNTPIINYNGAHIHHPKNKDFIQNIFPMARKTVFKCLELVKPFISNAICEYLDDVYIQNKNSIFFDFFIMDADEVIYGNLEESLNIDPISLMIILSDKSYLEPVKDILKQLNLTYHIWGNEYELIVEINSLTINKYTGVKVLKDYFNIEETIAFGDADNDLEMLKNCCQSYAMKNGNDNVKSVANNITVFDNDNDGVALILEDIFNL